MVVGLVVVGVVHGSCVVVCLGVVGLDVVHGGCVVDCCVGGAQVVVVVVVVVVHGGCVVRGAQVVVVVGHPQSQQLATLAEPISRMLAVEKANG